MISDFHLHCNYSGDSDTPMENMVERGISLGLPYMCFTDHYDIYYPETPKLFLFSIDEYYKKLKKLQIQYSDQIKILFGIELGLQPHIKKEWESVVNQYPFDFVIGSTHVVEGIDPYHADFFKNRTEEEGYAAYFQATVDNLNAFDNYDIYGHIDYVVRYGPNKNAQYSYQQYRDIIDTILKLCIEKGIGIECNTSGFKYLGHSHPHPDIIKRYRELGGEIITVGSDGHVPEHIAYDFQKVPELLKSCGFSYYTIFENRKPRFIKL